MQRRSRPIFPKSEDALEISDHGIEVIPFRVRRNSLTVLSLPNNSIRRLPRKTVHLTTLCLSGNGLEEIPKDMVKRMLSYKVLEVLDLSENGLLLWPKKLDGLNSLQQLVFHYRSQ